MVTFKLKEETTDSVTFLYYPEGREDKHPGTIIYNKGIDQLSISELAEDDWERDISIEELDQMADTINLMIIEAGSSDFVETAKEPGHIIFYGDHAIREIRRQLDKGQMPESGMTMWY